MGADTELRCLTCKKHISGRDFDGLEVIQQFLIEHTSHHLEAWSEYSAMDDLERWENLDSRDVTAELTLDIKG